MPLSKQSHRAVALTGLGVIAPIGRNEAEVWQSLKAGRDGMRPAGARMLTAIFREQIAATLDDSVWREGHAPTAGDDPGDHDPCVQIALAAAEQAWRDAGLQGGGAQPHRAAIVLGTSAGGLHSRSMYELAPADDHPRRHRLLQRSDPTEITRVIADALGIAGPRVTVSTACTSSTHAVVHGRDLLLAGLADVALVGGIEILVEELMAGFHAMGAMSPGKCAPFSLPPGLTLGEGAGFAVLERAQSAAARGARTRCLVLGSGLSADGWHPTAPDPSGNGVAQAMTAALGDAGISTQDVGYLNAHGTGTDANDAAEWRGIGRVFGARAAQLPVSSTKGHLGHALGAAGILELVATVLCMEHQVLPPTLHWAGKRGHGPGDPISDPSPRACGYRVFLKSSSGFGGANASVVVGMPDSAVAGSFAADDTWIVGTGVVGAFGWEDYDGVLRRGEPTWKAMPPGSPRAWAGRVPDLPYGRLSPGTDTRSMPSLARHILVATRLALSDAGVSLRGELRRRAGLFVGARRPAWEATRAFYGSVLERGYDRASAPGFAQLVLNASLGLVSAALGMHAAQSVVAGRRGGALAALVLASHGLATRRDSDLIVVGAGSEATAEDLEDHGVELPLEPCARACFELYGSEPSTTVLGEGAAMVVVAAGRILDATGARPIARVAGTGASGPGRLGCALAEAIDRAGWSPSDVDAVYGSADGRDGTAAREIAAMEAVFGAKHVPLLNPAPVIGTSSSLDAFALAAAVEALRRGSIQDRIRVRRGRMDAERSECSPVQRVVVMADDDLVGAWVVAIERCGGNASRVEVPVI